MNLLTIAIDRPGTTSHHRRLVLERLLPDFEAFHIDTAAPFDESFRLARSLAFRTHSGPAVTAINRRVLGKLDALPDHFDLVWIDKAVFLKPATIRRIRERAGRMIHYTPDTAFLGNRSRHFNRSGSLFDLLVTTKSFELDHYRRAFPQIAVHLSSQGYFGDTHRPLVPFGEKRDEVAFAGLAEPSRLAFVEALLEAKIPVRLAGKGWGAFLSRHGGNPALTFEGEALFGEDYTRFLSSALFSPGLLSRRFPELHTTRTFEIPACGTALLTERNEETCAFFREDEAIFHDDVEDLIERIGELRNQRAELERITEKGRERVQKDGRDYDHLLASILAQFDLK